MANVTGGDKLKKRLREIKPAVAKLRVGFLGGVAYPGGISVAMVAVIQEYGAPAARIPPRPFFRNMIAAHKSEWPDAAARLMRANDYNAGRTLNMIGEAISGQLRQSIIDTNTPPLSPVTLMVRKMRMDDPGLRVSRRIVWEAARRVRAGEDPGNVSHKPLVDTGKLLDSISYEVV